jgi:hypothetical protein
VISAYRLIDKTDVAVTRPALDKAGWRCEVCRDDEELRVIDQKGNLRVLCDSCRVKIGSLSSWSVRASAKE